EVEVNINLLKQNSSSMQEFSEHMDTEVTVSLEKLGNFNDSLFTLVDGANVIQENNKQISNEMFVNLAKLDHVLFKLTGYEAVFEDNHNADFSGHTTCRFGKWYSGDGKTTFSKTDSFSKIDAPHKAVHESVKSIPAYIKDDSVKNADKIIENFRDAEKSSKDLFGLLNSMMQEKL
ncbi:MAG: chemotaxis protein, partial [Epsilonproteobacteria bacterium]